MEKLRISVVSYLNAEPFREGLTGEAYEGFILSDDIPSVCAEKLLHGEADLGLVPVAIFPKLKELGGEIVTQFCIGAEGEVASVMLFSEVPVKDITAIILDKESRTSVKLMQLLASKYFKIQPEWINETDNSTVKGTVARLLIGNRALHERGKWQYETDLALSWNAFTGFPFVFAAWVAMRPLSVTETRHLNHAFEQGLSKRNEIAERNQPLYPSVKILNYLEQNIQYRLTEEMMKGLDLFLTYLQE